jgi:hypothetical protein
MLKFERPSLRCSLLHCLERGYFSSIRYLVESGHGNIHERDQNHRTVLMYCCNISDDCWTISTAMMLLEHGARINDRDRDGLNALHYAVVMQRLSLVKLYLASVDFNLHQSVDIYGNTCLHYACLIGHVDIVRCIINMMKHYSIDLTMKNFDGLTAYDIARQFKHVHCENLLRPESIMSSDREVEFNRTVSDRTMKQVDRLTLPISTCILTSASATIGRHDKTSSISNSSSIRQQSAFFMEINDEHRVCSSSILTDLIRSRTTTSVKHNIKIDCSLVNQFKTRPEFCRVLGIDQCMPSSSSSSTKTTWRQDFARIHQDLQTCTTSSYRPTAHLPSNNQLPCETTDRSQSASRTLSKQDFGYEQSLRAVGSQKNNLPRQNSSTSSKTMCKTKKVNLN